MTQIDPTRLQEMSNLLVEVAVKLRQDPTELHKDVSALKQVVEEIERMADESFFEMNQGYTLSESR